METKESIYTFLKNTLVELFDVDAAAVILSARLYEDLDIDSLDAVDLVLKLKEVTGKKLTPADFKEVRTVEDVVDAVFSLVNNDNAKEES